MYKVLAICFILLKNQAKGKLRVSRDINLHGDREKLQKEGVMTVGKIFPVGTSATNPATSTRAHLKFSAVLIYLHHDSQLQSPASGS